MIVLICLLDQSRYAGHSPHPPPCRSAPSPASGRGHSGKSGNSSSILGALAAGGHLDQARVKLAEDGDEVALRGHDFADVFTGWQHRR